MLTNSGASSTGEREKQQQQQHQQRRPPIWTQARSGGSRCARALAVAACCTLAPLSQPPRASGAVSQRHSRRPSLSSPLPPPPLADAPSLLHPLPLPSLRPHTMQAPGQRQLRQRGRRQGQRPRRLERSQQTKMISRYPTEGVPAGTAVRAAQSVAVTGPEPPKGGGALNVRRRAQSNERRDGTSHLPL